jgi:hypothetical protein
MQEYFELENMGEIKEGEYAYAFSHKEVIVGSPAFIYTRLESELEEKTRSSRDLEMIDTFLKNNQDDKYLF